jgi:hypothetical protein
MSTRAQQNKVLEQRNNAARKRATSEKAPGLAKAKAKLAALAKAPARRTTVKRKAASMRAPAG